MRSLLKRLFIESWQRKLVALLIAIIVWIVVDHSIKIIKTFPNVQIRVVNLPQGYTIKGIQPNGLLSKTISLSITGQRSVLQALTSYELEIVLNAEGQASGKWTAHITRYNLTSTSDVDLTKDISKIEHKPLIIQITPTQTAKIPVFISYPSGEAPAGYEYAGCYPKKTEVTVRGSKKQLQRLKETGISLTFDLARISKKELEEIEGKRSKQQEYISFTIPKHWKKIRLPFSPYSEVEIDDPKTNNLTMSFLRAQLLPIGQSIPINVFFGNIDHTKFNPSKIKLQLNDYVIQKNGLYFLKMPLFAANVSNRFIDVTKNNITLVINFEYDEKNQVTLHWNLGFVNRSDLEKKFLKKIIELDKHNIVETSQKRLFKYQFYNCIRYIQFFTAPQKPLAFDLKLENNEIIISPKKE